MRITNRRVCDGEVGANPEASSYYQIATAAEGIEPAEAFFSGVETSQFALNLGDQRSVYDCSSPYPPEASRAD